MIYFDSVALRMEIGAEAMQCPVDKWFLGAVTEAMKTIKLPSLLRGVFSRTW